MYYHNLGHCGGEDGVGVSAEVKVLVVCENVKMRFLNFETRLLPIGLSICFTDS